MPIMNQYLKNVSKVILDFLDWIWVYNEKNIMQKNMKEHFQS